MNRVKAYGQQVTIGGWTRIEMLLAIYDKAIEAISLAQESKLAADETGYTTHMLAAQKAVLAIHAGLKPDTDDVAFNVARLLHFVLGCIENDNLVDAIKILENMRSGFAAIADEANQLEAEGQIPPLQETNAYEANA